MVLSPHQILSILIIVFFTPTVFFSVRACFRHGIGKQFGWLYLLLLTILRLVGAALQIASGRSNNTGLTTAASLITSIGIMALLLTMLEIITMLKETTRYLISLHAKIWTLLQLSQWAAFILSIVGMTTSRNDLNAASTIIVSVLFVVQATICVFLFLQSHRYNDDTSLTKTMLISTPFLGVRVVYALLTTFANEGSTFGQMQPNVIALALLQFLMELIVVCLFLYVGLVLFPSKVKTPDGSQILPDEPTEHYPL